MADLAKLMQEPASMISAYKNVGQICGYYREEGGKAASGGDDDGVMDRLRG